LIWCSQHTWQEYCQHIRGFISGNAVGNTTINRINGRLFADKTGLTIPYLNVDYELSDRSVIDLVDEKFLFRNNALKTLSLKRKVYQWCN
jgi:hypothetical protein